MVEYGLVDYVDVGIDELVFGWFFMDCVEKIVGC